MSSLKDILVADVGAGTRKDVGVDLGLRPAVEVDAAGKDAGRAGAPVGTAADGVVLLVDVAVRPGRAGGGQQRVAANEAADGVEALPPAQGAQLPRRERGGGRQRRVRGGGDEVVGDRHCRRGRRLVDGMACGEPDEGA